jgi:hypothetical protein
MFKMIGSYVLAAAMVVGCGVDTAYAQKQSPAFRVGNDTAPQTINFTFGLFVPKSRDAVNDADDVLAFDQTFLTFDVGDFKAPAFGVEYLLPIASTSRRVRGYPFSNGSADSVYATSLRMTVPKSSRS